MKLFFLLSCAAVSVASTGAVIMQTQSLRSARDLREHVQAAARIFDETRSDLEGLTPLVKEYADHRTAIAQQLSRIADEDRLRLQGLVKAGPARGYSSAVEPRPEKHKSEKAWPLLTIDSPRFEATVEDSTVVQGHLNGPFTGDVWVFVWPTLAPGRGWPQGPAVIDPDRKTWRATAFIGGPSQGYEIAVYAASPAASATLRSQLRAWSRTGSYSGLATYDLPVGLVEQERINVTKK
jgi:hypothetical protein